MNAHRSFSYKRVAQAISPYTASSQYSNTTSQQVPQPQETFAGSNFGYSTQLQVSHQPSYEYSDATFLVATSLAESVPPSLPYDYYTFQTEQLQYQNSIPSSHQSVEPRGPEDQLEAMFSQLEDAVLNDTSNAIAYQVTTTNTTRVQTRKKTLQDETMEAVESITKIGASSPPATERFVKPLPKPTPVKGMPVYRGKRISRQDKEYVRRNSGDETDNYYENHAMTDGRNSTSEQSAGEEEVDSPVDATPKEKSRKTKKHRRDRDTSVSSNLSTEPSPKRVARESKHKLKKKSTNEKPRRSVTPDRSPSRSRLRSVSVVKSFKSDKADSSRTKIPNRTSLSENIRTRTNSEELNSNRSVASHGSRIRHSTPLPQHNRHATPVSERPDTEALNNSLFYTFLENKATHQTQKTCPR